ncbi:hypothetical protein AMATHDRAFT_80440 [Amanita thiersii Skay4041]|uniref:Trafficking protein particle complex II-specific subunit 65 IgD3 domain-containing protein n=1 Tax=Amanita thiersii Skay4041 TaxID=703135 RepID=A0A2A9NS61_9AGAR|nr:hypothetical protein AMATHDRAFT_80440 [Amanita thiersii Skay4041]
MSFEHSFASASLDVAIPDSSLDFPTHDHIDDWLASAKSDSVNRKQAFFDEQLHAFFILRIKHPILDSDPLPESPPQLLLSFLAHLQVSFEATYISPLPDVPHDTRIARLSTPPRASSLLTKANPRLSLHPSIFPPNTPNPTPSAAEHDRKYATSEGTLLLAGIWGQNPSQDSKEHFTLLWSPEEQVWVAIYSLSLTISFVQLHVSDPLLCLTVSATLRDKPITTASSKHPLAVFLEQVDNHSTLVEPDSPGLPNGNASNEFTNKELHGLEEVNLLQGLFAGPTFNINSSNVYLPSSRLGTVSRQKLFSLPPINLPSPELPTPSPMTAIRAVHPTLRKSFRRTLHTVSGFRVRMRPVFVPYVLLARKKGLILGDGEDEREKREAGNDERTVVLCVEVENSGDAGPATGFRVEKVDIKVGGDHAQALLIGWGEEFLEEMDESKVFPLEVEPYAQYNLLYAVWFLQPPEELDGLGPGRNMSVSNVGSDLNRTVTIYIHGKPYENRHPTILNGSSVDSFSTVFPTRTFSSRWNCTLNIKALMQGYEALDTSDPLDPNSKFPSALPEPPSPFPLSAAKAGVFSPDFPSPASTPRSSLVAGSKRFSAPVSSATVPLKSARPITPFSRSPYRQSDPISTPPPSNRQSFLLPSQSLAAQSLRSPTTYTPLSLNIPSAYIEGNYPEPPPLTPAYPPHSPLQPSPISQGPVTTQGAGSVGPTLEPRRERGSSTPTSAGIPPISTPSGGMYPLTGDQRYVDPAKTPQKQEGGDSIVVSVRLMSPHEGDDEKYEQDVDERIYPLTRFMVEVFVFNRSTWTRRFELSCPNTIRKRRRERISQLGRVEDIESKLGYPGILPMDNRLRIGPLRPSACQTVRMQFLAVSSGVHSIDTLMLTDIETGYSMNLRSVMDVVVHEVPQG